MPATEDSTSTKDFDAKPDKGEGQGEEQEVCSQADESGKVGKVSEDVRKSEDSLAVINRQAEVDEGKEKVRVYSCTCTCECVCRGSGNFRRAYF